MLVNLSVSYDTPVVMDYVTWMPTGEISDFPTILASSGLLERI